MRNFENSVHDKLPGGTVVKLVLDIQIYYDVHWTLQVYSVECSVLSPGRCYY